MIALFWLWNVWSLKSDVVFRSLVLEWVCFPYLQFYNPSLHLSMLIYTYATILIPWTSQMFIFPYSIAFVSVCKTQHAFLPVFPVRCQRYLTMEYSEILNVQQQCSYGVKPNEQKWVYKCTCTSTSLFFGFLQFEVYNRPVWVWSVWGLGGVAQRLCQITIATLYRCFTIVQVSILPCHNSLVARILCTSSRCQVLSAGPWVHNISCH